MNVKLLALPLGLMLAVGAMPSRGANPAGRPLTISFIDVEGGASTLIVTPAGESILVDAGWPENDSRDAKRIVKAMQQAGVTQIDHMIMTHYHVDHYGGIPNLAALVPIRHFYNHGPMTSLEEDPNFPKMYAAYQEASHNQSRTLAPGDSIPLKSQPGSPTPELLCVAGNRQVIKGASKPKNDDCGTAKLMDPDPSDNARSLGFILSFGGFRFLDLGDLTWNIEQQLVCPVNHLGHIDLYQVTHHGMNISNNPVLLRAITPTVAVMNNGPRKGGHPDTVSRLKEIPSLKAIYQLHRNVESSSSQNVAEEFIANPDEQPDSAYAITTSVDPDKKVFTITNERTGATASFSFK
ncbi:MAG TPA: MBL fold metallo-hydrolase [Blastocatellia bacterium]